MNRASLAAVVGLAVLLCLGATACQDQAAAPASAPTAAASGSDVDSGSTPTDPSGLVDPISTGNASGSEQGTPIDMKVRVANVYAAKGAEAGQPIDVWAGDPGSGNGRKLLTVPYGQVSDFFAPVVFDQGTAAEHDQYTLTMVPSGKSGSGDVLMQQQESSSPGQQLTMILGPGDADSRGGSLQVFADELGSAPDGSGFTSSAIPSAAASQAVIKLNALGVHTADSSGPSFVLASADGQCLSYIEPDTGQLHDPKSDTTTLVGGSSTLSYLIQPGQQARVHLVGDQQAVSEACHGQPVATADPQLAAGKGAYGFLFGATAAAAKLLLVPIA